MNGVPAPERSPRKAAILELANHQATERRRWIDRNAYYYRLDYDYMRFLIPRGLRVLELGCGTGALLARLEPTTGYGIDFSPRMVEVGREEHPHLRFIEGDIEEAASYEDLPGPFDTIVLSDTIGSLDDCQRTFGELHRVCDASTRLVIAYYSMAWEPLLRIAQALGLQMPRVHQNWLSTDDMANLLELSDFEIIKREWRVLVPRRLFGLGTLINRYLAPLPLLRRLCLRNYIVARSRKHAHPPAPSATVLIPCRNERGNIRAAVERLPAFCPSIEILFVEGHSQDDTLDEIKRVVADHPERDIRYAVQPGKGKGDAVRHGFALARGEVLMILDADLTVPPEALPKFYDALVAGKGEFINGSRLVYPMEKQAMQLLNLFANQVFSWLFTWLLNQRFTDTLCGTKVLRRADYLRIADNRAYFGDFDPFGDFDLLFGAAKLNLKVTEIPVRYAARAYGETQISRFRHGLLLARMVLFAFRKLKAF
ncbi:MAG: glycosyltransferase [Methylotetracoccus sp.]